MTTEIAGPKPDLSAKANKNTVVKHFLKGILKGESPAPKLYKKICRQITTAALMQPLQYDSHCPAAKDHSITHAAAAPRNLDIAITMRYPDIKLQNTIELRAKA